MKILQISEDVIPLPSNTGEKWRPGLRPWQKQEII